MISSVRVVLLLATFLQFLLLLECIAGGGTPWATSDQEAMDEIQDAEILKSVIVSMQEWQRRHDSHRRKRAESSVCYPDVGCFQDSGPFSYLDMLPSAPEEVSTRFLLYSGRARGNTPVMDVPFSNLSAVWPWAGKAFNISAPTKVIVHGFGGSCSHVWVYEMRSALMTVEDCNVICVDWEAGALIPNYVRAAANTRLVGKQLSMLLGGLNKHLGLPFHNVHVIGFSLGAHVAGFAGAELKNLSRITGLDPAAPLFESQDPRARLDSSDAMFVDVIHSNGENLILGGLGSWQPMGDVDFYPNGGRMQKGCTNLFVGAVTDILWSASDVEGRSLCNHRRAYKFFTDSVSPRCHFPSFPCESYDKFLEGECFPCNGDRRCGNMGYYADRSNGRGTLFLITRDEEPFCAHQYHVRVESTPNPDPVTSYGKIQLTLIGSSEINETFALTQKDDEELKMGNSLARIAVPHPVLQEPKSVQVMYTAYSGWISSGLGSWNIDKVTLTDSFGKSMSVCKKGLVLDSGVPVNLPLYPGECNPPRDDNVPDTSSSTVSSLPKDTEQEQKSPASLNGTENVKYTPTTVVQMGDELLVKEGTAKDRVALVDNLGPVTPQPLEGIPWHPIDYLDSSNTNSLDGAHSKRENSRSLNSNFFTVGNETVAKNQTHEPLEAMEQNKNGTFSTERPEIKEPVLNPSTSRPPVWPRENSATRTAKDVLANTNATSESQGKPEITEPVLNPKTTTTPRPSMLKAREIASGQVGNYHNEKTTKWMPALDLNPPPLGGTQTWQHWITETTALNSIIATTETPVLEDKSDDTLSANESNGEGRKLSVSSTTKLKKTHTSPITIQFFPQRLAAILAQAERYARLTFSFPMAAISKLGYKSSETSENDQLTSASNNRLFTFNTGGQEDPNRRNPTQRRPKHFTTVRPNTKTSEESKEAPVFQPRIDSVDSLPKETSNGNAFVPYTYAYASQESKGEEDMPRYIPLLRNNRPNNKNKQNYRRSNSSVGHTTTEKSRALKHSSSAKEDNFNFHNFFKLFLQYPRIPER